MRNLFSIYCMGLVVLVILFSHNAFALDQTIASESYFEKYRGILDSRFGVEVVDANKQFFEQIASVYLNIETSATYTSEMRFYRVYQVIPRDFQDNKEFLLGILLEGHAERAELSFEFFNEHPEYSQNKQFFSEFFSKFKKIRGNSDDYAMQANGWIYTLPEDYSENKEFWMKVIDYCVKEGCSYSLIGVIPSDYSFHKEVFLSIFDKMGFAKGIDFIRLLRSRSNNIRYSELERLTSAYIYLSNVGEGYERYLTYIDINEYPTGSSINNIKKTVGELVKLSSELDDISDKPSSISFKKISDAIFSSEDDIANRNAKLRLLADYGDQLGEVINSLHEDNPARTQLGNSLPPEVIYLILASSDEIFTSSFRSLWDILAYKLAGGTENIDFDETHRTLDQINKIRIGENKILEMSLKSPYNEYLQSFYGKAFRFGKTNGGLLGDSSKREMIFNIMINNIQLSKENLWYAFPFLSDDSLEKKEKNYLMNKIYYEFSLENTPSLKQRYLYALTPFKIELLSGSTSQKELAGKLPEIKDPPSPHNLIGEDNVLNVLLYFTDEGGLKSGHFELAKKFFKDKGFLESKKKNSIENLVYLENIKKDVNGLPIKINLILASPDSYPITEFKGGIIMHRGHSYEVESTFSDGTIFFKQPTIVFLGSCGGFETFFDLSKNFFGNVGFMGTRGVGRGSVNNNLLYDIFLGILSDKDWFTLENQLKLKNDQYSEYVFPNDISFRIIRSKS